MSELSGLTAFMTEPWQLILCWGVLVGLGTGSMALALVATATGRWFVARRGLVSGVLTAGGAAGALIFLPLLALVSERYGWRPAALGVAFASLGVAPLVVWLLVIARATSASPPTAGRRPTTSCPCASGPGAPRSGRWPRPDARGSSGTSSPA